MRATWPDGRVLSFARTDIWGDHAIIAQVRRWLAVRAYLGEEVRATPTGPFVAPDITDPLAVFAAVCDVAPGGTWEGVPDFDGDAPPDAVF